MKVVHRCLGYAALLVLAVDSSASPALAADQSRAEELENGLRALQAADLRIATIAFRLATANRDLCRTNVPLPGFVLANLDQYSGEFRPAAGRLFNIGEAPTVTALVPGGPAEQAGLAVGDRIMAVNGASLIDADGDGRKRRPSRADYDSLGRGVERIDGALASGPATLTIERQGGMRTLTLVPVQGCPAAIQLLPSGKRDAGADGRMISLTTGMFDFTRNDDELATVIGHELAHNGLEHRLVLDAKDVKRGLLGQFGKNATRIRQTECEADHVGIYYMARAGYDISGVPDFYRRLGRIYDLGPLSDRTHPSGRKREEAAQRTLDEIAAKREQGLPLVPVPDCGDNLDQSE